MINLLQPTTALRPALIALAAALFACGGASVPTIESTTFATSLNVDLHASTKTADGEYFRDLAAGTGAVTAKGQVLQVNYTGWLADGTQFDSSTGRGPFSFHLGAGEVIQGWDEGLTGVHVGSTRQLIIPSSLGYGSSGQGPIPPNAILVFTVQVLSAN